MQIRAKKFVLVHNKEGGISYKMNKNENAVSQLIKGIKKLY